MPDRRPSPAPSIPPGPVEVRAAQMMLLDHCSVNASEQVPLTQALGRIASASHIAKWPLPQWRLSKMDGYAVGGPWDASAQSGYALKGESAAGVPCTVTLGPNECVRVSTGAVLPCQSYAVVPQEDVQLDGQSLHLSATAQSQLLQGRYIREVGSDLPAQRCVSAPGQRLDEGRLSLLAAVGYAQVEVFARPRVGILCTGSELVPLGQTPQKGQIVATNAMVLRWQCERAGAQVVQERYVGDSGPDTQAALHELSRDCDLILTCGGISVGPHDHVLPSLNALGWEGLFRKVKLAPGRPTTAGRLAERLVLALPGNPASSYVTFELFVRPLLRKMSGLEQGQWFRPTRWVHCDQPPRGDSTRDRYLRVQVQGNRARPLATQQSGDLSSMCGHNALLELPANASHAHSPGADRGSNPERGPFRALLLSEHNFEG